jgi:hypothetical protein
MGRLANQFITRISLEAIARSDTKNAGLWQAAYIEVAPLTAKALPELSNLSLQSDQDNLNGEQIAKLLPVVKQAFIGGKVAIDGELVDAEADDIDDFPLEVSNLIISAVMGQPDPKSLVS